MFCLRTGSGPSAMILSYILHGYIPFYFPNPPHPDPLLDAKLRTIPNLLHADVEALTAHFAASRLSYSTQALPANVLLDTLVRPSIDTDETGSTSHVEWRYVPEKAISHVVFGKPTRPGGQWTEDPHGASWDIQTLSYATMLSLPGYSFEDHFRKTSGEDLPPYTRPTRREIAEYFRAYPAAVHIDDVFRCGEELTGISRTANGFHIQSHNLHCKRLVLASGIFWCLRQCCSLCLKCSLSPQFHFSSLDLGSRRLMPLFLPHRTRKFYMFSDGHQTIALHLFGAVINRPIRSTPVSTV